MASRLRTLAQIRLAQGGGDGTDLLVSPPASEASVGGSTGVAGEGGLFRSTVNGQRLTVDG